LNAREEQRIVGFPDGHRYDLSGRCVIRMFCDERRTDSFVISSE
jgi:hypothetical protein